MSLLIGACIVCFAVGITGGILVGVLIDPDFDEIERRWRGL